MAAMFFGISVDTSKERVIVGASKDENDVKRHGSGSAYIFTNVGDVHTQEAKLNAERLQKGANFGLTVALDTNRALIGAPSTDTRVGCRFRSGLRFFEGRCRLGFAGNNHPCKATGRTSR